MMEPSRDRRDELYEEYLRVPPHQRAEIVGGTLYVMSRPAPRHASAASAVVGGLHNPFQLGRGGPGGWWIIVEPELQLVPKEPVAPDVAGWRTERVPQLPETAYFKLAPDWVCEVLSPSTERLDREKKLPFYAEHGVPHVWLIDPIAKHLEVYSLDRDSKTWLHVRIYQGDIAVRAAPFEAVEIDLSALWWTPRAG